MHQPVYIYALVVVVIFMIGSSLWNGVSNKLDAYDTQLKAIKALVTQNEQTQSEFRKKELEIQSDIQSKATSASITQKGMETAINTIQDDVEALTPQTEPTPQPQANNQ